MATPLQSVGLTADELKASSLATTEELGGAEVEHHIHMTNPSLWPLILSVAIAVTIGGLLFVNTFPWISIIAAPFILLSIVAWGLENPFASRGGPSGAAHFAATYAEAAKTGKPTLLAEQVLEDAQDVADR